MSTSPENYKTALTSAGHTYNYYNSASPASKTTLLFIHGFPYTSKIWRHQVTHFEKLGYGCIVPDILAHGKSSRPTDPKEYAMPVSAKSMMEILDKEGVERAVIVGHDWGSAIASRIALIYPSRTQALVLVCIAYFKPAPFDYKVLNDITEQAFGAASFGYWEVFLNSPELLSEHTESFFEGFFAKEKTHWVNSFTARGKLREWLTSDSHCEVKPEIEDVDKRDFFANDWSAVTRYYHCLDQGHNWEAEKDIPAESHTIIVPTLMVAATDDGCSPLPFVQSSMDSFKDGKIVVIDGDHHIFLESQANFNSELETFFAEKGVKSEL